MVLAAAAFRCADAATGSANWTNTSSKQIDNSRFMSVIYRSSSFERPRTDHGATLAELPRRVNGRRLISVLPFAHHDAVEAIDCQRFVKAGDDCHGFVRRCNGGRDQR